MNRFLVLLSLALAACGPSGGGRPDGGGDGGSSVGYLVFPDQSLWTHQPSIAVDGQGAVHLTYATNLAGPTGYPVRYAVCPGGCSDKSRWTVVELQDATQSYSRPSLRLDASGKPRAVWFHEVTEALFFSTCTGTCSNASGWVSTQVADTGKVPTGEGYFALDGNGKPAFVYVSDRTGREGVWFTQCTGTCTDRSGWGEVKLNLPASADRFSLAFDGAKARLAYRDTAAAQVGFLQCDANCTTLSSWSGGNLFAGDVGTPALKLDKSGRPRLLFYSGGQLQYAWCESGCQSASAWQKHPVGVPDKYGEQGYNLVLDAQNRPRLTYSTANNGVGYSSCKGGCESTSPQWKHALVETGPQLDTRAPVDVAAGCSTSPWFPGGAATLALDANGNPKLAYEARHEKGGSCQTAIDQQYVRVASFPEIQ